MTPESWARVGEYWKRELGVDPRAIEHDSVSCRTRSGERGVQLFRNRAGLMISAPTDRIERFRTAATGSAPAECFSVDWLTQVLGEDVERILGPANLHYADASSFRPGPSDSARVLATFDSDAYRAFLESLDSSELEESGVPSRPDGAYGAFDGGRLCGVASFEDWHSVIAQLDVATAPDRRRQGFATAAVSALARDALRRGLILQWRATTRNGPSLALARSMAFEDYASVIYVRLRA